MLKNGINMKVLLNDGMDKEGIALFEEASIETDLKKRNLEELVEQIGKFDALIVRSATDVTKEIIEAGAKGSLKIIGRAGVGYDNIDVDAATYNGIIVKNAPYGNTNATAELALLLMLSVSRKLPQAHYLLKNGIWQKKSFQGTELFNKTLGIIGCGRVGQRLSELVRGFDMNVIGHDKNLKLVEAFFPDSRIKYVEMSYLLAQSDFISIHVSGNNGVIGAEELSQMKPSAYLINASRGLNVDEKALYEALATGRIAGAGLDVYVDEPKNEKDKFSSKLAEFDNVVLSPHLGASTKEAQRKTSIEIADAVIKYLFYGDFKNAVNVGETVEVEKKQIYPLFICHRDIPGAFAKISDVLARHQMNIRENPSRQLENGYVMTVYLLHQLVNQGVIRELNNLEIVKYAKQ